MTQLLEKAIEKVSKLSAKEQNNIAKWLLEELESEKDWGKKFNESEDVLSHLAKEAVTDYNEGKTSKLNIKKL